LKKRFFSLATGLRVKDMNFASKLVISAMILHNLCIQTGDKEKEDGFQLEEAEEIQGDEQGQAEAAQRRDRRRNQLLMFFQRN
jgi:hypothetical protein